MHTIARCQRPPSYPPRAPVPEGAVEWSVDLPGYDPPYFVDAAVLAAHRPGGWADPEELAGIERELVSFEGPVARADGVPLNPRGRTGVRGRGLLGRWGANFAADAVVVRPSGSGLEMIAIERKDSGQWAIPGGMVDGAEEAHQTAARELAEETGVELDLSGADLVYRGYVDDRRNTDNAWMETTALLYRATPEEAAQLAPRGSDDAAIAGWQPLVEEFIARLYASHAQIVRIALGS